MTSWQHLVVAIADPFTPSHLGINKVAAIAARCGARVTLFNSFSLPYPLPDLPATSSGELGIAALHTAIEHRRKALQTLARPLRRAGVAVDYAVEWDFPAHEAIVRFLLKSKADLLVAESHRHGVIGRWFLANTDWELIRACPCPLWFVKTRRLSSKLSVLAAVDPLHAHAKPAQLDDRILDQSVAIVGQLGGVVRLAHAYEAPLSNSAATFIEPLRIPIAPDRSRRFIAGIKRQVQALAQKHALPASRCVLGEGNPVEVLPRLVKQEKVDVLVMGAVSRSELKRPFIGNTAEKVIDKVGCDLLIIKPANFRSSIPRRSAGERLKLK